MSSLLHILKVLPLSLSLVRCLVCYRRWRGDHRRAQRQVHIGATHETWHCVFDGSTRPHLVILLMVSISVSWVRPLSAGRFRSHYPWVGVCLQSRQVKRYFIHKSQIVNLSDTALWQCVIEILKKLDVRCRENCIKIANTPQVDLGARELSTRPPRKAFAKEAEGRVQYKKTDGRMRCSIRVHAGVSWDDHGKATVRTKENLESELNIVKWLKL
ncbi:hypothetical protein B0H14DRAFT_2897143 [Mycena olivaceomarginata]|nr:hypothetical protein B0H14DRAFT_2897143 [Mycena olivaceomarginata]